ncbi:MAG TPA: RNA polymerase factor sigma-54 [Tepidisphaeraceae bacterium]|nr:RNA polymerase factor sigma-54 [Tepidisphaeraceae bacterium]
MRHEMRQLLTPRMIQSMEILQLPLMALEERIEQELEANPVLELNQDPDDAAELEGSERLPPSEPDEARSEQKALVVKENNDQSDDFARLDRISEYLENEEFSTNQGNFKGQSSYDGERDKKLDAMNNTASRGITLTEYLLGQWTFVDVPGPVREAGKAIINYIDGEGYLRVELDQIRQESKTPLNINDLREALSNVQTLEPSGVGARNLQECLLIQLAAIEQSPEMAEGHDLPLERSLITDHLKDLEMNRYPQISKKLGVSIEAIQKAVHGLRRLNPYPGRQIGGVDAPPITPDAVIFYDPETDKYEIEMTHDPAPNLHISALWKKYLKERKGDKKTREFLSNNVRNARWLIESIEQRRSTIMRVIRAVVDAQRDFFDKGQEFLRPLPMVLVAEQLGIHVATVSRAVSEKWVQTPRGVFPLRRFFSQGTTSSEGEDMAWGAVQEKLKTVIDNEDKLNPLNDDEIVQKMHDQGIELARRTVAKYRKILNIPTARQRRQF